MIKSPRGKTTMLNILNENSRLRRVRTGCLSPVYDVEIEKYKALKNAIENYFP